MHNKNFVWKAGNISLIRFRTPSKSGNFSGLAQKGGGELPNHSIKNIYIYISRPKIIEIHVLNLNLCGKRKGEEQGVDQKFYLLNKPRRKVVVGAILERVILFTV